MGPDMMMMESGPLDARDPSSPRHLPVPLLGEIGDAMDSHDLAPLSASQPSPRSTLPLPNPPFTFPARPSSSSAPSSYSRATGRRPRSAIEIQDPSLGSQGDGGFQQGRSPALPDFSFNPGATLSPASTSTFLSPPQTPSSPRAIPTRPTGSGHRRGGSEFVGGNIRAGEAITVMSTSPTKSESGMASPQLVPTHPSGRARGHRHQRSAAISSHDLTSILQPKSPNPSARGSSAPTSPADFHEKDHYAFPITPEVLADPKVDDTAVEDAEEKEEKQPETVETPLEEQAAVEQTQKAAPRARVAFSDTLDYIPRPLSLVSSDTSSTVTVTARPGQSHSASGSISSIISASNSTIAERDEDANPAEASSLQTHADSRPSTAGAILERTDSFLVTDATGAPPRRRGSLPLLTALPPPGPTPDNLSTPSPTKTPKRWSFFGIDPFPAAVNSPTRSRPVSASSSDASPKPCSPALSSAEQATEAAEGTSCPAGSRGATRKTSKKASKKQKKVKNWAGSILTRKSKPRHGKSKKGSKRAPTPPPDRLPSDDDDEMEDSAEPAAETVMPTVFVTETATSQEGTDSWKAPRAVTEDETTSPMIDLDAALGPFNTPLPLNPEWEAAQRAGGFAKRRLNLHSAAGMSRFTGPGMHYTHHQRAQSSPEMVPFEHGRRGIHRFGSSSTMADVFEEEEEEEDGDQSKTSGKSTPLAEPSADSTSQISSFSQSPGTSDFLSKRGADTASISSAGTRYKDSEPDEAPKTRHAASMRSEPSLSSLQGEIIIEEPAPYAMQGAEPARTSTAGSTGSATPSPRFSPRVKDLSPVEVLPINMPSATLMPISPYSMTQSSSYPSPRSPLSYDANRISTAPSSVTEDNFQSLLMGEPGPEVRLSVDIPSLTSSNSTTTRDSVFAQLSQPPARGERPSSLTSTAFGIRRSSLAGISRLISSSHGVERSKLSMEVTYASDSEKKEPKISKAKRLSRLIQFWKTTKNDSSST